MFDVKHGIPTPGFSPGWRHVLFRVCHAFLSAQFSLVVTGSLGSLVCGVLLCFVSFPSVVVGQCVVLDCIDA